MDRQRVPLPNKLGPFVVGAKIGGGGMASVYLGRRSDDTHPDLKLVALKIIRDDLASDPKYWDMFADEAKILSRLRHPNIIAHVDYGHTEHHGYIAMELVLGRSLMDTWDACAATGKRMPIDVAAWVALQVADALAYAHSMTDDDGEHAGLIHRDVNPANIFLTYDGQVKLLDFGLAKARGRRHDSVRGVIKGKVAYFAPEQIMEDICDHRIDIYALGATLWELTTARRLFKRDNDIETVRAIQAHVIPDPRGFVEGFYPESLWHIVDRALQKHPSDRYGSAREMAEDLRSMLARYGRSTPMQEVLAAWVEELFPGEHAAQSAWLIGAVEGALSRGEVAPVAPIAQVPEIVATGTIAPPAVAPKLRDDVGPAGKEELAPVFSMAPQPMPVFAPPEPPTGDFVVPPLAKLPAFSEEDGVDADLVGSVARVPSPRASMRANVFVAVVVVAGICAAAWLALRG